MEKNFYRDDFEQFLKDTTDDFRMYPSKRVWNSLYNNLHPGRKWPSLAVCILLLSSVIFIGIAHKNEISGNASYAKKAAAVNLIAYKDQKETDAKVMSSSIGPDQTTLKNTGVLLSSALPETMGSQANKNAGTTGNSRITGSIRDNRNIAGNETVAGNQRNKRLSHSSNHAISIQLADAVAENEKETIEAIPAALPGRRHSSAVDGITGAEISPSDNLISSKPIAVTPKPVLSIAANNGNMETKEWIEDYVLHNKPKQGLKSRLAYQWYITPSAGYRTLEKNITQEAPSRSLLLANASPVERDLNHSVTQSPAFNVEAGYSLLYAHSKSVRLKAGIQFNFTNYRIYAHDLGHSTSTNLLLNNPASYNGVDVTQMSTTLANLPGDASDKKLNNSTFQVSIPLGADIRLAGKASRLQWFAGATVQPTYVLFGNAYLISSDLKNYVYDSKFLRKWNLNAGIETFLSYKTKKGIAFSAGPQLRYQFLSTYNKSYSYTEKLYNLGVKVGMTRNF